MQKLCPKHKNVRKESIIFRSCNMRIPEFSSLLALFAISHGFRKPNGQLEYDCRIFVRRSYGRHTGGIREAFEPAIGKRRFRLITGVSLKTVYFQLPEQTKKVSNR